MLVVKRKGKKEKFDERKIYGSTYAACANTGMGEKQCELVSASVSKAVKASIKGKKEASSEEIAKLVGRALRKKNPDAAFMYETHRDVS